MEEELSKSESGEEEEVVDPRFFAIRARSSADQNKVRWFFRLYPSTDNSDTGLAGFYGEQALYSVDNVIIAKDARGHKRWFKMFSLVQNNPESIYQTFGSANGKIGHYYELIGLSAPVFKPYFDIDIPTAEIAHNPENVPSSALVPVVKARALAILVNVCRIIDETLRQWGYKLQKESLWIYVSHYQDELATGYPRKFSYHIVLPNYRITYENMRILGLAVKNAQVNPGAYIDDIWHRSRQFRLLGSSKPGSKAVKEPYFLLAQEIHLDYPYIRSRPAETSDPVFEFAQSLVTNCPENPQAVTIIPPSIK